LLKFALQVLVSSCCLSSVPDMCLGPSRNVVPQIQWDVGIGPGAMECRASGAVAEIMVHPFDDEKFFVHARQLLKDLLAVADKIVALRRYHHSRHRNRPYRTDC